MNSGGKQPLMKDGYFMSASGELVTQSMVFLDGPNQGLAKGLKQVCLERFGPEAIKGKRQDGLVEMLENEPDFKLQKPQLVEVVEAAGGKVVFGTKFHPELMPIENSYRSVILETRLRSKVISLINFGFEDRFNP